MSGPWNSITNPINITQKTGTNVNASNIYRDTENNIYNKFLYYRDYYNSGIISDTSIVNKLASNEETANPAVNTYSNGILVNSDLFSTLGLHPKETNDPTQNWNLLPVYPVMIVQKILLLMECLIKWGGDGNIVFLSSNINYW